MKILESTERRLVIESGVPGNFNTLWLPFLVNIFVTTCFYVALDTLPLLKHQAFVISSLIGWLLVHLLFSGSRRSFSYWFAVVFGAIPLLGMILSLGAINSLTLPKFSVLTLDRDRNVLIVEKPKILSWHLSTQYPLSNVVCVEVATESFYSSATGVTYCPALYLCIRKENGGIRRKKILTSIEADSEATRAINRFLLEISESLRG